jgi:hypothetical protein
VLFRRTHPCAKIKKFGKLALKSVAKEKNACQNAAISPKIRVSKSIARFKRTFIARKVTRFAS